MRDSHIPQNTVCPHPAQTKKSVVLVGQQHYSSQSFPMHNTEQHILIQPLQRRKQLLRNKGHWLDSDKTDNVTDSIIQHPL